ncbi:hypothetical protein AGMMS50268_20020 [Spirochaetia bacterium]|nr:hypothetical protein AGMMS50268_20020 [Spirochaetia bacterium]
MNKRINFEDNIFILGIRIRMIRDLLVLDTDPELFLAKTIEDVDFIDHTLEDLLKNLIENERLLERNEAFDSIYDLEWDFSQALSDFFNGSGNISAAQFPMLREKLQLLRSRSQERRKSIDSSRGPELAGTLENVVSSDEMSALLKDF